MSSTRPSRASRYSAASSGPPPGAPARRPRTTRLGGAGVLGERARRTGRRADRAARGRSTRAAARPDPAPRARRPAGRRGPGRARERGAAPRRSGPGNAAPGLGEGRDAMLAVAAEQLVGALAGERDGHVSARELAQRQEAERRQVGERLVEVPDERRQVVVARVERPARARGGRRRARRRRGARRGSSESSPAKPTAKVLTGSVMCRAISATIRLESRPPLSIAPSGTSLISRRRTDSSSLSSSDLGPLVGRCAERSGRRAPGSPTSARRRTLAVRDDQALAGLELAHVAQRRHRARHVAEHQVGGDRVRVELAAHEPAREHALQLGAEDDDVAGERVVERLDARAGRGSARRARSARSHTATANMPRSRSARSGPWSSYRCGSTSVSQRLRSTWPRARELVAQRAVVVDLAVLGRPDAPDSFANGWWPPSTSMIESRRAPSEQPSPET